LIAAASIHPIWVRFIREKEEWQANDGRHSGEGEMCPACFTTLVLMAAGALSTGGLATLVVRKVQAPVGVKSDPAPNHIVKKQGGE
jgi:hypothetical protein